MYCANCGNSVNEKLKYCNGCGERLASGHDDIDVVSGKMLNELLTTLFLIVMIGLGSLVGLVAILLNNLVPVEAVVLICVVYLATVFGICFTLLRQVPKLIDAKLGLSGKAGDRHEAQRLAPRDQPLPLNEFRQPASVTDRTTRTLDEIEIERK